MDFFKKILSFVFRISISVVLLIFLFRQVDLKSLLGIIKGVNKPLLSLALAIFLLNYLLSFYRWLMILKAANLRLPLKRVAISYSGAIFFSLFLPSTIGGDLVRSVDLSAHTKRPSEVVATVILDRLSGYVGLVSVALVALLLGKNFLHDRIILAAMAVITAVLAATLLALFNRPVYLRINNLLRAPALALSGKAAKSSPLPMAHFFGRLRELLTNTHKEIHYFRNHKKIIALNVALSFVIQLITPLVFYIIALSLGLHAPVLYFFVVLPIVGAITLLPISLGGLGLRDASVVFFFAKVGVGKDAALSMSLLNFAFILAYSTIGGLIYVLTVHHRRL